MRVAVVGGTGFIGGYLIDELLRAGHEPVVLVRSENERGVRQQGHCTIVKGDIDAPDALTVLLRDCDAAIYNVGILRENKRRGVTFQNTQYEGVLTTVDAARRLGVSRFLLMSAKGARLSGTPYQETKKRAEDYAFASGLDTTVFRPSVVFGNPRGLNEIASQLHNDMIVPPLPAVAFHTGLLPRRGQVRMSPVHVEDVASAFVAALSDDTTIGQIYELGGPETLTWRNMLERVAAATARKKWIVPMPIGLMRCAAILFDRLSFFPVTRDQLDMLAEGNVASDAELRKLIGREPRSMAVAELKYLQS